ncbi:MAG TPA: hypothetical protein VH087_21150 [Thermoanaerobaculia bacterium]|jgi:hypothetical protein|nr:hypothetical protein [Thermoanaerobaculia bacterium]
MAVQIAIHRVGGSVVFDSPQGAQQSDLVFWLNDDNQPHFPVPGCGSLRVAPGNTTSAAPYQGFPDTTANLPLTFQYICALHSGESGLLDVAPDTAGSPAAGSAPVNPQLVAINITRSGSSVVFDTVDVAQGDKVYWNNQDNVEHWPVPNCTGLLTAPGKTSNGVQLATSNVPRSPYVNPNENPAIAGPPPLPMAITYGCAIPGHEAESGTINIYDNLSTLPNAPAVSTPGIPIQIITGGKSPYTVAQDPAHPELTIQEMTPQGTSSGVAVVLNQKPAKSAAIALQVNVTDALGKNLNQPVPINLG